MVTSLSFDNYSEFLKLGFSKGYSISIWSMNPDTKVSCMRLPCYMSISCNFFGFLITLAIVWSSFDSLLRVYTADGMCFAVGTDKSETFVLLDDETNRLRNTVLRSGSTAIDAEGKEDQAENDEQPDQIILYGAASSCNGLYDCILFSTSKSLDVNYKRLTDESCSIIIRPLLEENDEIVLEDLVKCFRHNSTFLVLIS
jgi:hypothetical protein